MRANTLLNLLLFIVFLFPSLGHAQETAIDLPVYEYNLSTFSNSSPQHYGKALSMNSGYESHPELGIIPFNFKASTEVVEVLEERTAFSRKFININKPSEFYLQQFRTPIHQMKDGYWQTLDHRIQPNTSQNNVYESRTHYDYKHIDINNRNTQLGLGNESIKFNNWTLQTIKNNQVIQEFEPNWSNYTIGDEGMYISNIFNGIDAEIIFTLSGEVTTNFIINQWNFGDVDYLSFKDQFDFSQEFEWSHTDFNNWFIGELYAYSNNQPILKINKAIAYPQQMDSDEETVELPFMVDDHSVAVYANSNYIQSLLKKGKSVVIDPVITGTNAIAQANLLGSMYNATCNFTNYCDYDVTVDFPPYATITDVQITFSFIAQGACWKDDGAMRFTLGSCISPDLPNYFWMCNQAPLGPGTCSATNLSIFDHIQSCVPDPSCINQDIEVSLQFFRRCIGQTGCSNDCIGASSPFGVTVIGHTVEFDDNLTTSIAANRTTICQGETITVSTNGQNGVPPYTYTWSLSSSGSNPLGTGSPATLTFNTPGTHWLYAIITDDCNQTIVDSILITVNPLQIPLFTLPPYICLGDNFQLPTTSNNNVSGTWSPANVNTSSLGVQTFVFTPHPNVVCSDTASYEVEIIPVPVIDLGADTILCYGKTTILDPGITNMDLLWQNGYTGPTFTVTESGQYWVSATTESGCEVSDTINVTVLSEIRSTERHYVCTEDFPFQWNGQSYNNAGPNVGEHIFESALGCDSIVTLAIESSADPYHHVITERGCFSASFEGQTYTSSTILFDTLQNTRGCDSIYREVRIIVENNTPEIEIELEEHCNFYTIDGKTYTQDTLLTIRRYTSMTGCDSVLLKKDIRIHHFNMYLNTEFDEVYEGEVITLLSNGTEEHNVYRWEPSELFENRYAQEQSLVAKDGPYTFTVYGRSTFDCVDSASVRVNVIPLDKTIVVPNAFSPNNDGVNDVFNPILNITRAYSVAEFSVYNRLGQRVFASSGQSTRGWDGTFMGEPCPIDTYIYVLKVEFVDGDSHEQTGDVHLLR